MAPIDAERNDELPADLRAFYESERALPAMLSADGRARILDVVTQAAPPVAATGGFSLATVIVASVVSAAVGAGLAVGVVSSRSGTHERSHAAAVEAVPAHHEAPPLRPVPPDAPVAVPAPSRDPQKDQGQDPTPRSQAPRPAGTASPPRRERTTDERNLVDRARAAIARGHSHNALLALMELERSFPAGALREEREYLVIVALVAERKIDIATARATAYQRAFPRGTYLTAIDRLLGRL